VDCRATLKTELESSLGVVSAREVASAVALFLFLLAIAVLSVAIADLFRTLGREIGAVVLSLLKIV